MKEFPEKEFPENSKTEDSKIQKSTVALLSTLRIICEMPWATLAMVHPTQLSASNSRNLETGETIWGGQGWHSPQLPSTQNGCIWDIRIKMCQLNLSVLYGVIIYAVI